MNPVSIFPSPDTMQSISNSRQRGDLIDEWMEVELEPLAWTATHPSPDIAGQPSLRPRSPLTVVPFPRMTGQKDIGITAVV
jgi:hypothetical protein